MGDRKIAVNINLVAVVCANCAMTFAIPERLGEQLMRNGKTFVCPLGHGNWYGKSEADLLRENLDEQTHIAAREAQRAAAAEFAAQAATKEKNKLARQIKATNKRIHAGVCPCCNRTFQNLAQHMATKHKETEKL